MGILTTQQYLSLRVQIRHNDYRVGSVWKRCKMQRVDINGSQILCLKDESIIIEEGDVVGIMSYLS